ncbi:MAG: hypothetical protein AVDCRST_MAG12-3688, partial [uncultured Rubrobacteraceae bacterium]
DREKNAALRLPLPVGEERDQGRRGLYVPDLLHLARRGAPER